MLHRRKDAENRLKLEAAIRALQLFGTDTAAPSSPTQRAGAIFMLASLAQHDLALALLEHALVDGDMRPTLANAILDHILTRGTEIAKRDAITLVCGNAHRLVDGDDYWFPAALMDGCEEQSPYVRRFAGMGLAELLLARSPDDWRRCLFQLYAVIAALALLWHTAHDNEERADVGAILAVVLGSFEIEDLLHHPSRVIEVAQLRIATQESRPSGRMGTDIVGRLRSWVTSRPNSP
jgi:hypothetical protein